MKYFETVRSWDLAWWMCSEDIHLPGEFLHDYHHRRDNIDSNISANFSTEISILHLNIQGLPYKISVIENFNSNNNFYFLLLNEHWYTAHNLDNIFINNFFSDQYPIPHFAGFYHILTPSLLPHINSLSIEMVLKSALLILRENIVSLIWNHLIT